MPAVIVAVGGGGDAITSAALSRLLCLDESPVILTYSWDRLLVDPIPGPRRAADFTDLAEVAPDVLLITDRTRPRPPAGSSLPRLAIELPAALALLDPTHGAAGMARQIVATAKHFGSERLYAVDVGGDALTDGHDPGLRSPLADQLAMAACLRTGLPTRLLIAAAGIDGELSADTITGRLKAAAASVIGDLTAADTETTRQVLRWHPSEASALLSAAAIGMRGTVEVRDAGDQVVMTDQTVEVHSLDLAALGDASPAAYLIDTHSLDQAEQLIGEATGISELRYETAKAAARSSRRPRSITASDLPRVDQFAAEAAQRGADFISLRRLAELLGATSLDTYAELTRLLAKQRPKHFAVGAYRTRSDA